MWFNLITNKKNKSKFIHWLKRHVPYTIEGKKKLISFNFSNFIPHSSENNFIKQFLFYFCGYMSVNICITCDISNMIYFQCSFVKIDIFCVFLLFSIPSKKFSFLGFSVFDKSLLHFHFRKWDKSEFIFFVVSTLIIQI